MFPEIKYGQEFLKNFDDSDFATLAKEYVRPQNYWRILIKILVGKAASFIL